MSDEVNKPALRDLVRALRPRQWTKNAVVLAAFVFLLGEGTAVTAWDALAALAAALVFCVVSSGVYVMNDLRDLESDRKHAQKKFRPIAQGLVPTAVAWRIAVALLAVGCVAAWFISREFCYVVLAYVAIQLAYSLALKRVALLDVLVIAGGFVLRAMAGAVVLNARISPWLLLCAFLLALFLGLCKRRHEKVALEDGAENSRESLEKYDRGFLDQLISIVASATIVSYSMYTLSEATVAKFGTEKLGLTIPFVVFGIFRYLDLVYRHKKGDRPEEILLTDAAILVDLVLYGITLGVVFWL